MIEVNKSELAGALNALGKVPTPSLRLRKTKRLISSANYLKTAVYLHNFVKTTSRFVQIRLNDLRGRIKLTPTRFEAGGRQNGETRFIETDIRRELNSLRRRRGTDQKVSPQFVLNKSI